MMKRWKTWRNLGSKNWLSPKKYKKRRRKDRKKKKSIR